MINQYKESVICIKLWPTHFVVFVWFVWVAIWTSRDTSNGLWFRVGVQTYAKHGKSVNSFPHKINVTQISALVLGAFEWVSLRRHFRTLRTRSTYDQLTPTLWRSIWIMILLQLWVVDSVVRLQWILALTAQSSLLFLVLVIRSRVRPLRSSLVSWQTIDYISWLHINLLNL